MAETFPTLSRNPLLDGFSDGPAYDITLRDQFDSGHVLTKQKHSSIKRRFQFAYDGLTDADKTLLETLQTNAGVGAEEITWTNPDDSTAYTVRLDGPIIFTKTGKSYELWACEISMTEV